MAKYLVTYEWYGTESAEEIEADNPKQAMYRYWKKRGCGTFKNFVKYCASNVSIEPQGRNERDD